MRPRVAAPAVIAILVLLLGTTQAFSYTWESNSSAVPGSDYSISMWINNNSFSGTQMVILQGIVSPAPTEAGTNITVSVESPGGTVVLELGVNVSSSGFFSTGFESGQDPGWTSGSYTVTAQYEESSATTSFDWTPVPFSIFWITDTQFLSDSDEPLFAKTTQWIVDHWSAYDGKMVVHTGDIVQDAGVAGEWANASAAMSLLLSNDIPYTWNAGNHDILGSSTPNWIGNEYQAFNPAFVSNEVDSTGYSTWVSSFDNGMDTSTSFTVDGTNFLIVNIEWDGNSSVLAWVNALLSNPLYETYHVIIATHAYIDASGVTNDPRWGAVLQNFTTGLTAIMDNHSNVFLTMNGHYSTPSGFHELSSTGTRYELMFNRQDCEDSNGCQLATDTTPDNLKDGAATVTILTFYPQTNQIMVRTFAVDMGTWLNDTGDYYALSPIFPTTFTESVILATSLAAYHASGASVGVTVPVINSLSTAEDLTIYATLKSGCNIYVLSAFETIAAGQTETVFLQDLPAKVPAGNYTATFFAVTTGNVPVSAPTTPITIAI